MCNANGMFTPYTTYQNPYYNNQAMYMPDLTRHIDEDYDSRLDASPAGSGSNPITLKDYGPNPYAVNLEEATKQNKNYRTALWTGNNLQLTLMSINVGEDIGLEVHPVRDQFLRIEEGQGVAEMGPSKNNITFRQNVSDGSAVFVPAGTWHNVTNTGNKPLKIYSIYAPPQHPRGTVHGTKAIAHAGSEND
jgi:mannose-6-phosphate isomerase-like protein (cupin superfamily)